MLISHPAENNHPAKPLVEHLRNVCQKMKIQVQEHNLNLSYNKSVIVRLAELTGLLHDIGKATIWFQDYIKGNSSKSNYTNHSLVSAVITYFTVKKELKDDLLAYIAFQVVLFHHSNLHNFDISDKDINIRLLQKKLKNINDFAMSSLQSLFISSGINYNVVEIVDLHELSDVIEDFIDDYIDSDKEDKIEMFFLTNYLFSLLIDNDKGDAARLNDDYFRGNLKEEPENIQLYIENLKQQQKDKFDPNKPINIVRNSFLNEIADNPLITADNHFYSITSPTGIGKTFGCLVFANKLKKIIKGKTRIIYCLPYTSIIDQNYLEFKKILEFCKGRKFKEKPNRYLLKHHYMNPKKIEGRIDEDNFKIKDYYDDILFVESWLSNYVVTTFVQLFHALIGYKNRFLKKFHNIVNSIIILDEVQNIDPDYYLLIRETFKILGEKFGIYFLLITATQPEIIDHENLIELTNSDKYMQSKIFDRVRLRYVKEIECIDNLIEHIRMNFDGKSALIVMNTKRFAFEIYGKLKDTFPDYRIFCLTTNLLPYDRIAHITQIRDLLNKNQRLIVVSTQLIEAGVDLSFEFVYRDIAPLDSIIQVAGRCNRNGEFGIGNGKMFLFNLNNHSIYKYSLIQAVNDILKKDSYFSRDFYQLSKEYFSMINNTAKSRQIVNALNELNYDTDISGQIPINKFKLINDEGKASIYILRTPKSECDIKELLETKKKITQVSEIEEVNSLKLKIEQLKYELLPFKISLYFSELDKYLDYLEPQEELAENKDFPVKYISYKFQKKYAYDPNIGFLKDPKTNIENFLIL